MKKPPLSLLTVALSFALTACYSSGGGGGAVTPPKVSGNKSDSAQSQSDTDNSSSAGNNSGSKFFTALNSVAKNSESSTLSGALLTVDSDGSMSSVAPQQTEDLDSITVEGNQITLFTAQDKFTEVAVGKLKHSTEDGKTLYVGSMADAYGSHGSPQDQSSFTAMRYGAYIADGKTRLFVQGFQTPELESTSVNSETFYPMPKTSSFKYTGFALYGQNNEYAQLNAEVTADFSNKKVKVELKEAGATEAKATFGGEISGNTFSGTRNGIETQGAFYGSLARDVGGLFNDTKTGNNGVFGASDKRSTTSLNDF